MAGRLMAPPQQKRTSTLRKPLRSAPISALRHSSASTESPRATRMIRRFRPRSRVLCYQYGGESESGLQPPGSPANWRCVALEKLSQVRLLKGARHTAPNHSRPASCVVDADIDAEDQAERDPQKGQ